jgi:hypothetical protein
MYNVQDCSVLYNNALWSLADKYMTPHLPGVVQALQLKMLDIDMVYYMYLLYKYI